MENKRPTQEICTVRIPRKHFVHLSIVQAFLIGGIFIVLSFGEESGFAYWYLTRVVSAIVIFILFLMIYGLVLRIKVTTTSLIIRNIFIGGEKEYLIEDITDVQMRSDIIIIYTKEKRIARIKLEWENTGILLGILEPWRRIYEIT